MLPSTILLLGAFVCALGVVLFVFLAIKYRDEDFSIALIVAGIVCASGCGYCFNESVKKAENERNVSVDVQPGKR